MTAAIVNGLTKPPNAILGNPLYDVGQVLQKLHATIKGVRNAPLILPASINSGDCPVALTFAGPASWEHATAGQGWFWVKRQFTVRCFVKPTVQGSTLDEGYQQTVPLLLAFGAAYLYNMTLNGTINKMDNVSDNGALTVASNNEQYWGFEFRLRTWQLFSIKSLPFTADVPVATVFGQLDGLSFQEPE